LLQSPLPRHYSNENITHVISSSHGEAEGTGVLRDRMRLQNNTSGISSGRGRLERQRNACKDNIEERIGKTYAEVMTVATTAKTTDDSWIIHIAPVRRLGHRTSYAGPYLYTHTQC